MEMEKAHNWTDFDKLTTVPYNKHRKFVGVEYPGIIKNPERALKTLGGIDNLEKVLYIEKAHDIRHSKQLNRFSTMS